MKAKATISGNKILYQPTRYKLNSEHTTFYPKYIHTLDLELSYFSYICIGIKFGEIRKDILILRSRKILYCKTGNFKVKQDDMCNARAVIWYGLAYHV